MIKISPANAAGTTWKSFDVKIANLSKIPACILHSAYVNLYFDAIVKLSAFREDSVKEMYAMSYSARDTLNDYENSNENRNGEVVLPNQEISFVVQIPISGNKIQHLQFEYIFLPNFCYAEFEDEIFRHATKWYKQYQILKKEITLPNNQKFTATEKAVGSKRAR